MSSDGDLDRDGWCMPVHRVDAALLDAVKRCQQGPAGAVPAHRRLDEWRRHDAVRRLATEPTILEALGDLFGRRPVPFQTLNFAVGSEQRLHRDTIHFDSIPSGLMCGVWVALEDVGADQGPLRYVPGSHLLPPIRPEQASGPDGRFDYARYEDLAAELVDGMTTADLHARAGDVFVWHARLLHGGAPVLRPGSTRWSQVTHCFFEGAAYVTPMHSDVAGGRYAVRDPLIDISTGRRVIHRIDGEPAVLVHGRHGRTRVLGPHDPRPSTVERAESALRSGGRTVRRWVGSALRRGRR